MAAPKKRTPKQTSFIQPAPQVKGDILDIAQAAALLKVSKETIYKKVRADAIPYARVGRKLLFHRPTLTQWIADGGDRATEAEQDAQLTLDQLPGMLNNGKARIAGRR